MMVKKVFKKLSNKMFLLLLNLLSLCSSSYNFFHNYTVGNYKINNKTSIDYIWAYPGDKYSEFSTTDDPFYIVGTGGSNQTECELSCNELFSCKGYTYFSDKEDNYKCNLLSDLGEKTHTTRESYSWTKLVYYNEFSKHTIKGEIYTSIEKNREIEFYLDLNHNHKYDVGEPINNTHDNYFEFTKMEPGIYSIRNKPVEDCYQIIPGVVKYNYNFTGKGYVDYVKYYHSNRHLLEGGGILDDTIEKPSFNFITGNNNDTYLSFVNNDTIILGFGDEVVMNSEGKDIFFKTYKNSNINGYVSVSSGGSNFAHLGILTNLEKSFDLEDINFEGNVKFIRIYFTGVDKNPRNIVNIYGKNTVFENAHYSDLITIPGDSSLFLFDCEYSFPCNIYCKYNVNFDDENSCMKGCDLFTRTEECKCQYYDVDFKECKLGCEYYMNRYIYPNYTIYKNATGYNKVNSYGILNTSLKNCNSEQLCHGITFGENCYYSTVYNFDYIYNEDSYLLLKKKLIGNKTIDYMTTTSISTSPTTSISTSPTTSISTSPTTSISTSPTTSISTSPTTSISTSPTTSISTSPTTSISTSPTTSISTSPTTSISTSPTTSISTSPNIVLFLDENKINNPVLIGAVSAVVAVIIVLLLLWYCKSNKEKKIEYAL